MESQKELRLSGCNRRQEANMWPLTRKHSWWFAVLARIAVFMPCISHSNGSGYLCEKICIRSHGSGYLCKKKFASIRTAWGICAKNIVIRSKKIDICSNGSSYPFKTIIIISRRFHLSCSRLGRSGRSHATNLSKNVNDLMQALRSPS